MPKVMIVNGNFQYSDMFARRGWEVVYNAEEADLIQFTGGSDVSPSLYGHKPHPKTINHMQRDIEEKRIYLKCLEMDKAMAGICRGAQFLHVMNGGELYQHVDRHAIAGTHVVGDLDKAKIIQVTSTHHQMMKYNDAARILAICRRSKEKEFTSGTSVVKEKTATDDLEALFYETTSCLCFQPHPEYKGAGPCEDYYFDLMSRYLGFEVWYE